MRSNTTIAYFGYGSLVNLATLQTPYISAHRARLHGWKRAWLSRPKIVGSYAPIEGLAFLSVEPCEDSIIEGMVIVDHHSSLPDLDKREVLFERVALERGSVEFLDDRTLADEHDVFTYVAQQPKANQQARILRSYLDVVMRGYHHQFGETGVRDFIQSTANFDCLIHEDRDKPVYPRSIPLEDSEALLYDSLLPTKL